MLKKIISIGLTTLLVGTGIILNEKDNVTFAASKPPHVKISPTNVFGFYSIWFLDCENKPAGTEIMILIYDCDGNIVGSKFWKPCEGNTANDAVMVGNGNPGIIKYIMTVPQDDGSRRVIESDKISFGCP